MVFAGVLLLLFLRSSKVNTKQDGRKIDAAKLYLDAHLAEYGKLRSEQDALLNHKSNAVNFSLLVLAGLVSFLPYAIENYGEGVLLMITLPFWGLTWYMISLDSSITRVGKYFKYFLFPKINKLLESEVSSEINLGKIDREVLGWEKFSGTWATGGILITILSFFQTGGLNVMVYMPIPVFIALFFYLVTIIQNRPWLPF